MKKLAAGALCLALLWLLQALLMPKYMTSTPEGAMIREYYDSAGDHNVIFTGDCEVYENFSPVTLWEEHGINAWIRGSPQQTIWQSYYLMEETLEYETPDVMVYNVFAMCYDTPESTGSQSRREAYNRITLDGMKWSFSKWKAVQASLTEEEKQWEGILTYLFPILRFHDRWAQLTKEDVTYLFHRDTVTYNGYLMQTGVKPMTEAHVTAPRADYTFGENSWYYLEKMAALCRDHGVQLVLIKSPTLYPAWWPEWESQIEDFAREQNLLYVNMLEYQQELGIDWNQDTYDTGLHLNVYGAEKASRWFGRILAEECGVPDRRGEKELSAQWEQTIQQYQRQKAEAKEETQ